MFDKERFKRLSEEVDKIDEKDAGIDDAKRCIDIVNEFGLREGYLKIMNLNKLDLNSELALLSYGNFISSFVRLNTMQLVSVVVAMKNAIPEFNELYTNNQRDFDAIGNTIAEIVETSISKIAAGTSPRNKDELLDTMIFYISKSKSILDTIIKIKEKEFSEETLATTSKEKIKMYKFLDFTPFMDLNEELNSCIQAMQKLNERRNGQ